MPLRLGDPTDTGPCNECGKPSPIRMREMMPAQPSLGIAEPYRMRGTQ